MCSNKAGNLRGIYVKTGADQLQKAEKILRFYSVITGISPKQLRDSPKTRTLSALRDEIGKHLCDETTLSLDEIGKLIGRKYFRRPPSKNGE
jgi:hypothetical protein